MPMAKVDAGAGCQWSGDANTDGRCCLQSYANGDGEGYHVQIPAKEDLIT